MCREPHRDDVHVDWWLLGVVRGVVVQGDSTASSSLVVFGAYVAGCSCVPLSCGECCRVLCIVCVAEGVHAHSCMLSRICPYLCCRALRVCCTALCVYAYILAYVCAFRGCRYKVCGLWCFGPQCG